MNADPFLFIRYEHTSPHQQAHWIASPIGSPYCRCDECCQNTSLLHSQNIAEFWNVMTRPATKNGFGLSADRAEFEVSTIEAGMNLLAEGEAVYRYWRNLLLKHEVRGVQVHDARLVANMYIHGVSTFNTNDFRRFSEITAIHPSLIQNGLI